MKIDVYCGAFENTGVLVEQMDAAGLDKLVLAAWPQDARQNGKPLPQNADVLAAARLYPDRLLACPHVHGLASDGPQQVARAAGEGCAAIVLFPQDGYAPDDRRLMPVLDAAAEHKLAVFVQAGIATYTLLTGPGHRRAPENGLAYPMRLDPMCRLYPDTNFLILNMGYPLMVEAWSVCHNAANIYLSLGEPGVRTTAPTQGYCGMGHAAFIPVPESKLVFGSGLDADLPAALARFSQAAERFFPGADTGIFLEQNPAALLRL